MVAITWFYWDGLICAAGAAGLRSLTLSALLLLLYTLAEILFSLFFEFYLCKSGFKPECLLDFFFLPSYGYLGPPL